MAENLDQVSGLLRDALILLTGGGQGNGRAIALGVAAAGAKVIVTDVRQDTAQSTADEIKEAYRTKIRLSHPDRVHGLAPAFSRRAAWTSFCNRSAASRSESSRSATRFDF